MFGDWTLRFMFTGVLGVIGAIGTAVMGMFQFTLVFAAVALAGWAGTAYMFKHAP